MTDKQKTPVEAEAFVVCHGAVGRFWKGQTVSAADLGAPNGPLSEAQLQRLLDLEAIAPAGSRKAAKRGQANNRDGPPAPGLTHVASHGTPVRRRAPRDRRGSARRRPDEPLLYRAPCFT